MNVLITGITGSGASYLAEYILENIPNAIVHGISRWHSTTSQHNLSNISDRVVLHECDLTDLSSVIRALEKIQPDYIFHLAAHANVKVCFDNPLSVLNNNVNNTVNLFEAVRILKLDPIIQMCGTSEAYGQVLEKDIPIFESHPLQPVNIYAVSKLTQEKIAMSYYYCYHFRTFITRMFAYINPRREDIFSSAFAKQVVRIERGQQDILYHGNLDSVRTLIDVRDAMESYWHASQKCQWGEAYNIGGNTTISVGDFIELLKAKSKVPIKTQLNPDLLRPQDVTLQIPNIEKFISITGWTPRYSIDESVDFLLDHYRNKQNV